MKFGTKRKDAEPRTGGSNGKYIKYFKKGEKTLRFLEEFDEWTEFYDHFSQSLRRSYPCTGQRDTCPGCTSDDERERSASFRWLVNALDPETGYVDLWKIPVSLQEDLERYEEKSGTLTDRHYTVIQFKSEGKVRYSIERDDKDNTPLSEYADKMLDHQEALQAAYNEAWGEDPADEESPVSKPSKRPKAKDEEDEEKPWNKEESARKEDDEPPFEGSDEEEEEVEELDEEAIYAMDANELKMVFRRNGIRVPRTSDEEVLREKLMEALS